MYKKLLITISLNNNVFGFYVKHISANWWLFNLFFRSTTVIADFLPLLSSIINHLNQRFWLFDPQFMVLFRCKAFIFKAL